MIACNLRRELSIRRWKITNRVVSENFSRINEAHNSVRSHQLVGICLEQPTAGLGNA